MGLAQDGKRSDKTVVLHLRSTRSVSAPGGANRAIWEIARQIDKKRFLCLPCFLINASKDRPRRAELLKLNGAEYYELVGGRWVDPQQIAFLSRLVKSRRARILHGHDYKANVYALILKALHPGLGTVATAHGYNPNTARGAFYCWLDRRIALFFQRRIVVCEQMRDYFSHRAQSKTRVIHNAIDTDFWRRSSGAQPASPRRVVGFVGRISREKGWKGFVEIAARVCKDASDVAFLVAGDGPDLASMVDLARQRGLGDRIEFLGAVGEMKPVYERMDVLLAPSLTEGLPLAQLEAGAMSVPVVASDVGGVAELIADGQTGLLASVGDIDGFAQRVSRLCGDEALRVGMGEEARRRVVEEFGAQKAIAELESLYAELCS